MEKGITLNSLAMKMPQISADPDKLSQIIINLLSNALKATEKVERKHRSGSSKIGNCGEMP